MDLASVKKFFASLTLQKLVPVILIVVIGLLLVKLLLKLFDRVLERSRLERTMFSFLRAAMRALLYTILVLVAASSLGESGPHARRYCSQAASGMPSVVSTSCSPLCKDSPTRSARCSSPTPSPGGGEAVPIFLTVPPFLR